MKFKNHQNILFSILCLLILVGCASQDESESTDYYEGEAYYDPLEKFNRGVFAFNQAADDFVLAPTAKVYRLITPAPARHGVTNFFQNLQTPIIFANQLLQADLDGAGIALQRGAANTLLGFGGVLDVASHGGIEYEREDFGQTLAVWGLGEGPYIVLPILGPSTLRDAVGSGVDGFADPFNRWLMNTEQDEWLVASRLLEAVDTRERLLDASDDLERNSFDYYATIRSIYFQNRESLIKDNKKRYEEYDESLVDIPDFD